MPSSIRYCLDCGWRLRDEECTRPNESIARMIEHAIETGHMVEADYSGARKRKLGIQPSSSDRLD